MHKNNKKARPLLAIVVAVCAVTLTGVILITCCLNINLYLPARVDLDADLHQGGLSRSSSSNVSSSNDEQRQRRAEKRLPRAIIIGSRKSGTRALLRFLELNPAVRPAHNEVHFFDNKQNFLRGFEWYRNQMPATTWNEIAIEKSPAYFVTNKVPERVKSMNSSIKLILIMRDPVTRLISDFSQLIANRFELQRAATEDTTDLIAHKKMISSSNKTGEEETIWRLAEKEFETYVLRSDGGIDNQRRAIETGMYSNHLERWLAHFSRDQFCFVDGEQLIRNPYEVVKEVETFLGLESVIRADQFVFDSRKGFYCILANATSNAESTHQDLVFQNQQQHICLSKSKGRRHVKVSKQLRDRLDEFYAPYNEYLSTLTGIDFNKNKNF